MEYYPKGAIGTLGVDGETRLLTDKEISAWKDPEDIIRQSIKKLVAEQLGGVIGVARHIGFIASKAVRLI